MSEMVTIRLRSYLGTSRVELAAGATAQEARQRAAELLQMPAEEVALSLSFAPDAPRLGPDEALFHGSLLYVSRAAPSSR